MAVYEVYTHPELRRYKTHVFSKATLFQLICLALTWIPPLLIGLRSQGFWQRVDTFIEQPEIHFKHELMLELQTSSDGSYVTWSTYTNLNNLQMDHLRVPVIKSWEEDINHDGLMDLLHMQIEVPLMDSEQVYGLKLLVIFDYILEKFAYMQMECAAFMDYTSPIAGASYQVSGDLSLRQKQPIGHKGIESKYNLFMSSCSVTARSNRLPNVAMDTLSMLFSNPEDPRLSTLQCPKKVFFVLKNDDNVEMMDGGGYFFLTRKELEFEGQFIINFDKESIINQTSIFAEDFEWSQIMASYSARNMSTELTGSYPLWVSGRGAGKPFIVNATIRYPVEYRILYYPGFWQLIKFGWVQYSTLLIIFWFIFQRIKVFIFSNQLVPTIVETPFKQKTN